MDYLVTTIPLHEPVSLAQAKRHLRVEHDDDDTLIASYLSAARAWCETFAHRAFLWQTVTAYADDFADEMLIPFGPLARVTSLAYLDTGGASQTVASTVYSADTTTDKVLLAYDQTWPSCRGGHHDVTLTYQAGHVASCTRNGDTLVVNGNFFRVNDPVQVYNVGGALPAGLSASTDYVVLTVSGNVITLALTEGGAQVTMTDAGTGTHYIDAIPPAYASAVLLLLGDLWMNRGDEDLPPARSIRELLSLDRRVAV